MAIWRREIKAEPAAPAEEPVKKEAEAVKEEKADSKSEELLTIEMPEEAPAPARRRDDIQEAISPEEYARFAELASERKKHRKKEVVAIRISPETLALAKATGKGYTGFLSRLLDEAIRDPEMVKRCL